MPFKPVLSARQGTRFGGIHSIGWPATFYVIGGSSCYLRLDGQVFFLGCLGEKANALALISALTVPFSQGTNTRQKLVGYLKVPLLCLVTNHQLLGLEIFKLNNYLFFAGFFAKLFIHMVQMFKNPQRMPIPHLSQQGTSILRFVFCFFFLPEIFKAFTIQCRYIFFSTYLYHKWQHITYLVLHLVSFT